MSIPNEALQKLISDIDARASSSLQQLQMVRTQISTCNREIRLLQLTGEELSSLPAETRVFEGVGKMFVHRQMPDVKARLENEEKGLKGDITDLEKKMRYLETTYVNAREGLDAILKGGRS